MLPPFDADGNLPPGVHGAVWEEFRERFGGNEHRRALLDGVGAALVALRAAGCRTLIVGGSFVTAKETPDDLDACFDIRDVALDRLDPALLTEQGRRVFLPCHLLPDYDAMFAGFFQQDKTTGKPKGIVALDLETLP